MLLDGCVEGGDTNFDSRKFSGSGPCVDFCNLSVDTGCDTSPKCVEDCDDLLAELPGCRALGEAELECLLNGPPAVCDVDNAIRVPGCSSETAAFQECREQPLREACESDDSTECIDCCRTTFPYSAGENDGLQLDCWCSPRRCQGSCEAYCRSTDDEDYSFGCDDCVDTLAADCLEVAVDQCLDSASCRPYGLCLRDACGVE
jgi:hypothetical protein